MANNTKQKDAIREVFRAAGRPLTPNEAQALAIRQIPRLGIATVYRAVKEMSEAGELARVAIPDEAVRYEPAQACGCGEQTCAHPEPQAAGHAHFLCRVCRQVFCLEPQESRPKTPKGFVVEAVVTTVHGVCGGCKGGSALADQSARTKNKQTQS